MKVTLMHYPEISSTQPQMAKSAFSDGLLPKTIQKTSKIRLTCRISYKMIAI